MTELKRPTICYTTKIRAGRIKGVAGGGIDVYSRVQMDSFLSQVADEMERVYYKASEKNNQDFLEVIKKLRGEKK